MASENRSVLVTGGTGFAATEIIVQLIAAGYKIVATSRDASKVKHLYDELPQYKNAVTFVSVPDITVPGTFDSLFQNNKFDYILHTASPIIYAAEDLQKDIIDPGLLGVKSLFDSAHKFGGSTLKRIVLTGSGVSTIDAFPPSKLPDGKRWTEEDWNPMTAEQALAAKHPAIAYIVSKALAERAANTFMESVKPKFDLTTLLPVLIFGPVSTPTKSATDINSNNIQHVYNFINGTNKTTEVEFYFYSHVDVRDVARAHVLSLTSPAASNQRIMLSSGDPLTPQTVVNAINKNFPELKGRVAEGNPDQLSPKGVDISLFSGEKAKRIFGNEWEYTSLETTVKDVIEQLLNAEKKW